MAKTLPDIRLSKSSYIDLYERTEIVKGTALMIQNKSTTAVYIQVSDTKPAATSIDGYLLVGNNVCIVEGDDVYSVWAMGTGLISVQPVE